MQKMIFVMRDYVSSINSCLSDGWTISSVHPVANCVTGSSYSHGDWGAYVVLEKPTELVKKNNDFLINTKIF